MQVSAQLWQADDRHIHMALDLAGHLAKVQFRHEEMFRMFEFFQRELGEWPDRPDSKIQYSCRHDRA